MHSSGITIELTAGRYQAKIVSVGAGLAELTRSGRHLVVPHHPETMPPAHQGKVLVPWPNRIANGCYQYQDVEYLLPLNDRATHAAIHGLLAWRDWQIRARSASAVTLTAFLPPSYGYPFALVCETVYRLDAASGLEITITTQNIGDRPAPYGAGIHPYLTCNLETVDTCTLRLPAEQAFCVDAQLNPRHLLATSEAGLDYRSPRTLGASRIDHTFKAPSSERPWKVVLTSPQQKMSVFLCSTQPWIQVYSGEKLARTGLAVEPMSCPPNAFNSTQDLISLAPQETHRLWLAIGGE
ncbi:aldose epimerase [Mixta theicola]|uniref:Aldose epimerase n=1 Tax=Mixta theicola TaxID=1458355 RepID=A0A2K1Q6P5_9GAMM|nr:aldose-1-epimerase [Mixta theicola]PNS10724.1 aldose epimerase [Mixta theicola]GLR08909.1 aldose 1-epimerase [Mixta theicola]